MLDDEPGGPVPPPAQPGGPHDLAAAAAGALGGQLWQLRQLAGAHPAADVRAAARRLAAMPMDGAHAAKPLKNLYMYLNNPFKPAKDVRGAARRLVAMPMDDGARAVEPYTDTLDAESPKPPSVPFPAWFSALCGPNPILPSLPHLETLSAGLQGRPRTTPPPSPAPTAQRAWPPRGAPPRTRRLNRPSATTRSPSCRRGPEPDKPCITCLWVSGLRNYTAACHWVLVGLSLSRG